MHRSFTGHQAFASPYRGLRHTYRNCGTLARKKVHFRGLRHTFRNCGVLDGLAQLWCGHRCAANMIDGSAVACYAVFSIAAAAHLLHSF